MSAWETDKRWSDAYIPAVKRIVGGLLIGDAPSEEDQQRNTDLIVLKLDAVRIGCRLRRAEYVHKYHNEFTIRAGRPNGTKTELAKIIEGWGDYFFYGFASDTPCEMLAWLLGDLKVFRLWFNRRLVDLDRRCLPGRRCVNKSGDSDFLVFDIGELPPEFIVGRLAYLQTPE